MLESIKQIVIEAGELIRHARTVPEDITSKEGRANYVTRYDMIVQDYLFSRLSALLPEAIMIGEENAFNQAVGTVMPLLSIPLTEPAISLPVFITAASL